MLKVHQQTDSYTTQRTIPPKMPMALLLLNPRKDTNQTIKSDYLWNMGNRRGKQIYFTLQAFILFEIL